MYLRLSVIGLALLLGAGGPGAWAAGKPRDACFSDDAPPDEMIAGCNAVLKQRKRETTSNVVNAFYNRGNAYVTKGETERAIKDFSEAITLDPSNSDSFHSRGSAFDDLERYDLALSDYEQALKLDPKRVITLVFRGITFKKMGELGKAISDFDAAIALAPERGFTYYSRGLAYEKAGDPARAQADLETAARLNPDDEDVREALKRVRAVVQARPATSAAPVIAPDASAPKAPGSGSSAPGGPATLADLEAQENATAAVWERLPFSARHAMFVSRKANAYGDYEARSSNVFEPGEELLTYLEPLGYAWAAKGDGYRFGVIVDFAIMSTDGKILGGQKEFLKQEFETRHRNRELFLNSTMSIDGAPAGNYVLVYTLHDLGSNRTTRVEQPFTIKAASAATAIVEPSAGQGNPAQAAATAPPPAETDGPCATSELRNGLIAATNTGAQFQDGRTQLTMLMDPETLLNDSKGRRVNCRYTSVWAEKQAGGGTAERRMKMTYKVAFDEKGESEVAYEFDK